MDKVVEESSPKAMVIKRKNEIKCKVGMELKKFDPLTKMCIRHTVTTID